jgi:hypothetical protein
MASIKISYLTLLSYKMSHKCLIQSYSSENLTITLILFNYFLGMIYAIPKDKGIEKAESQTKT